jgi:phosphatidylglycerol:prolipoprotein diacylglycerol transferase
MINLLHTFEPSAILFSFGPLHIYWYGLLMVVGILAALGTAFALSEYYGVPRDTIFDLAFWLIIGGLAGARLYDILLQLPYYIGHPVQILEIWKGGLAIHGAIIAGLLIIWRFARRHDLDFWQLTALLVPGLAFGQAVGRWGNYFNQELFGLPTDGPWGIPIFLINRPLSYLSSNYFQPTFLYESLGCLIIGAILIGVNIYLIRNKKLAGAYVWLTALYMILYSILRFGLEFIRLDATPSVLGLRWPQIASLFIIIASFLLLFSNYHARSYRSRPEKQ